VSSATRGSPGPDFEVLLSGGPSAGFEARQAILAGDGSLTPDVREDVLLLVTELVTNAVRHAPVGPDQSLRVAFQIRDLRVRVEVADPGTQYEPAPPSYHPDGSGGWGLVLVDRIADHWGVERIRGGTSVWFEIELGQSAAGPPASTPAHPAQRRRN
jgi:anti-sigma regulatory factor (Ser/Thr protein kinase)